MNTGEDAFDGDGPDDDPTVEEEKLEEEATTFYGSADEWVRKHLIVTYRRRVVATGSSGHGRWKAAWYESREAQQRIEALWRAWEAARQDTKDGMSTWWINHCDPHMSVLLSPTGPFAGSTDENELGDPLPYTPPPVGLFAPDQQPEPYAATTRDTSASV